LKEAASAQANAGKTSTPTASKQIAVYISQGLVASQVADLLYHSGVIVDRNAFEKLLNDQQISNKIQVGYHVFSGVTDPQQVIATLMAAQ
jgi:cell division protein YceG involved in septum cleavage